jgi:hypothetical protein
MPESLNIKPHHFLDIVRDFGRGIVHQPHPFGHNVHGVAEIVREDPDTILELTEEPDYICAPCRFLVDGNCIDITKSPGHLIPKDRYNRLIDRRIFERLGLKEGDKLTALEFCRLASERLGDLYSLYAEADKEKTTQRAKDLELGFKIYLAQ